MLLTFLISFNAFAELCKFELGGRRVVAWPSRDDFSEVEIHRADGSIERYDRTDRSVWELQRSYHGQEFKPSLWHGKKILDAGCGAGAIVYALSKLGEQITGLDIALNAGQLARPDLFIHGDMAAMPFADQSFDLILSTQSFITYELDRDEPDIGGALREIHRVLKTGGTARLSPVSRKQLIKYLIHAPGLELRSQELNSNAVPVAVLIRND